MRVFNSWTLILRILPFIVKREHNAEPKSDFYSATQADISRALDQTSFGLRSKTQLTSWDEVLGHCATANEVQTLQSLVGFMKSIFEQNNRSLQPLTLGDIYAENLRKENVSGVLAESAWQFSSVDSDSAVTSSIYMENEVSVGESVDHPSLVKLPSLDLSNLEGDGLKKYNSFSRWMSKELGEVDEPHVKSSSGIYWSAEGSGSVVEDSSISKTQ